MKVVLNIAFGGFHFGKQFMKYHNIESCWDTYQWERNDPELVQWVEEHPDDNPNLMVLEIPDNATDWQIHEYDGRESLILVIDGKIVWRKPTHICATNWM